MTWNGPPMTPGTPSYAGPSKRAGIWWMRPWPSSTASVFPPHPVCADGHATVNVARRFGTLALARQVFAPVAEAPHVMPGNIVLPAHQGMIITRGLQELACLLPQDLSFDTVTRLLGWQTQEAQVLSDTTVRALVRTHGQIIRQAEAAEVTTLLDCADLTALTPQLVPSQQPRRRAAWPADLTAAVDAALIAAAPRPPVGVSAADWERVLHVRREEHTRAVADLRRLGPEVAPDQVLTTTDEVLTRKLARRRFNELRTARVMTAQGSRYLSGIGESFLTLLLVMVLLCAGRHAKAALLGPLYRELWQGEVDAAIARLEAYRPQARNSERLDELIQYLHDRGAYIPNYRQRRRECQYIGSGHAEKANDLIVAQRQKGAGMHWSLHQ